MSIKDNRRGGKKEKNRLKTNRDIVAHEVRVIDDSGTMLGVMTPAEALKIAQESGLDLIEIAPTAKPPTCRIMDYGKWRYEAQKKDKESRKKQTIVSIKEIQIRTRTDQHDFDVKARNARKFLLNGDKVKVNLRFYGREMAHQDLGIKQLVSFAESLDEVSNVETAPKREGRQVFVLIVPDAAKIKDYKALLKREISMDKKAEEGSLELGDSVDAPVQSEKAEINAETSAGTEA